MKNWTYGVYAIVAVAALCLVVLLTLPSTPNVPTQPSTVPTQPSTQAPTLPPEPTGEVRLYQCDLALAQRWEELAAIYTAETGVKVTIMTPNGGDCAASLPQYMTGDDAATIFCLHHKHDLDVWKEQCLDLSGSVIAGALHDDIFALKDEDAIFGVASNIESYGIIYNSQLLARAGFTASDITDFASLKNAVENITANKRSLGFSAFASPDLSNTGHGGLLCLLAGLSEDGDVLRSFWDLYISNNVRSGASLTQSTKEDGLKDFLNGKAVFYLGGTWDYEALSKIEDYYLNMLPVYTPGNQDNLGLHHACTSYWCVNSQASELDLAASMEFLSWLVTAPEGSAAPADQLGLLTPYVDTKFAGNPLEQSVLSYLENGNNVHWNSCDKLSADLLEQFGQALTVYTKKPNDDNWSEVTGLKETQ